MTQDQTFWWQTGVIYQIYPRSFLDSNGDGVGDLPGIVSKLDYLHWLGVDALWLSPIYPSPMRDFGYDVSDYCDVDPVFGSLADLDALIASSHERGIRVLLDWVPNHSGCGSGGPAAVGAGPPAPQSTPAPADTSNDPTCGTGDRLLDQAFGDD